MQPDIAILALLVGYLLGSISFTRLVSRLKDPGAELETIELPVEGTNETFKITSMGASTASMKLGPKVGCAIGLLDILKVTIPTLVFRFLYPGETYFLIAAAAGMAGHNWPIFNRFKGGRGISAFYGGFIAIDWIGAILCAASGMVLGLFIFKDFVLAYMAGVLLAIPWFWFTTHDLAYLLYAVVTAVFFVLAMIPDLRQYLRLRKTGKVDMRAAMETSPMGRGMMKMMDRFQKK
jgi:acyl phosphate:glycerol-3-phosphate acyltransferase